MEKWKSVHRAAQLDAKATNRAENCDELGQLKNKGREQVAVCGTTMHLSH